MYSKTVRHLDQWDLRDLGNLRPLVISALAGALAPQPRAFGFLNPVDPLVLVPNYYVVPQHKVYMLVKKLPRSIP